MSDAVTIPEPTKESLLVLPPVDFEAQRKHYAEKFPGYEIEPIWDELTQNASAWVPLENDDLSFDF